MRLSCGCSADCAVLCMLPVKQRDPHTGQEYMEVAFEFRKLRFNYHAEGNNFERLRFPVHEPFSYYLKASGYGHGDKVAAAVAQWGLNKFEVGRWALYYLLYHTELP